MRIKVIIIMLAPLLIFGINPALGGDDLKDAASKKELQKFNDKVKSPSDWAVGLNVFKLDRFLDYRGSRLFPVAQVNVTVAIRDSKSDNFEQIKLYEKFWFHKKDNLGVSRKMPFKIPTESLGTVTIDDTPDAEHETQALCNVIVRLVMDAHLFQSSLSVVAPDNICQRLADGLSALRFHEVSTISSQQKGVILHLVSESKKMDHYLFDHHYLFEN